MIRRIVLFAATLLVGLVVFAGCVGVYVDEARVFRPQPVADKATGVDDMYIEWEDVFQRASNFTFTNNINNDRSTIRIGTDEFIPAELTHGFWADGTIAVTEIVVTEDGEASGGRPLVVHCGGNASDRYNSGALFGLKIIPHADVILFDYPGYGDSPGRPSAAAFEAMISDLAGELNERQARTDRPLVLWGYSLGGFVCARLSGAVDQVDAIIIESSARDAKGAARQLVPGFVRPFLRVRLSPSLAEYDNVEALKAFDGPVLVLAGQDDGILSASLSRELVKGLRAQGVDVTYHEFEDGNHANLPTLEAYKLALADFFSRW